MPTCAQPIFIYGLLRNRSSSQIESCIYGVSHRSVIFRYLFGTRFSRNCRNRHFCPRLLRLCSCINHGQEREIRRNTGFGTCAGCTSSAKTWRQFCDVRRQQEFCDRLQCILRCNLFVKLFPGIWESRFGEADCRATVGRKFQQYICH